LVESELVEDIADVFLHSGFGDDAGSGDALVGFALCNEGKDFTLTGGELIEWRVRAASTKHAADDLRVERTSPGGDARDGVSEDLDIANAFLKQVANARSAVADEVDRVMLLIVLREQQDAGSGKATSQFKRGLQAVVAPAGWHLDIDDRDLGMMGERLTEEVAGVAGLRSNVKAGFGKQQRDARSEQNVVFADDHADSA
jgi:hypothetical protein